MKRFVGLSLVCFMFASAHAEPNVDSNFSGSSWSVHMSQKNDEPIQVVSEQEEYDKNKILKHRKSRGFIDKNGVYKSVSEEDLTNSDAKKCVALLKILFQIHLNRIHLK